MDDLLYIYTVYDHPSDYPEEYVLRRSSVGPGGKTMVDDHPILVELSLETIRLYCMGRGLVCLTRHPDDDPVIVETWL